MWTSFGLVVTFKIRIELKEFARRYSHLFCNEKTRLTWSIVTVVVTFYILWTLSIDFFIQQRFRAYFRSVVFWCAEHHFSWRPLLQYQFSCKYTSSLETGGNLEFFSGQPGREPRFKLAKYKAYKHITYDLSGYWKIYRTEICFLLVCVLFFNFCRTEFGNCNNKHARHFCCNNNFEKELRM